MRLALAAAAVVAAIAGLTSDTTCGLAQAGSCRSACLQQYNECRISSKGSPQCDAQYQICLQRCVAPR
jgi:hypothetical protein